MLTDALQVFAQVAGEMGLMIFCILFVAWGLSWMARIDGGRVETRRIPDVVRSEIAEEDELERARR